MNGLLAGLMGFASQTPEYDLSKGEGFAWYKKQDNETRINFKDCMELACGVSWDSLTKLGFSYVEKIEMLHMKLKKEGFDV